MHWRVYAWAAAMALSTPTAWAADFTFGFNHVNAANTDAYLVSAQNARRYSEWQSPPVTYWGPTANGVPALLTYRFGFDAPSASISLQASLASFNFVWGNANGWFGNGIGSSSLWGSTDGNNWQLLLDNPTPANWVDSYRTYNQNVPSSLLGASEFWVQVRMEVSGAPNSSYTTAQFCRSDQNNPNNVFQLAVTTVPEPSVALLSLAGLAAAAGWRHARSSRRNSR